MRGRDAARKLTLKVNIFQVFSIDFSEIQFIVNHDSQSDGQNKSAKIGMNLQKKTIHINSLQRKREDTKDNGKSLSSFPVSLSLSLSLSVSVSLYLRVVVWSCCCVVLCLVLWCVCVVCSVVCVVWHAENPRVSIQNVPVCTFKTSPCVPAPRAHVETHVRAR